MVERIQQKGELFSRLYIERGARRLRTVHALSSGAAALRFLLGVAAKLPSLANATNKTADQGQPQTSSAT